MFLYLNLWTSGMYTNWILDALDALLMTDCTANRLLYQTVVSKGCDIHFVYIGRTILG